MSTRGLGRRKWRDDLGTALLAVILAVVVWVNATYQSDRPREDYFSQPIPIEVLNAPAGLVATNTPSDQVNVKIKAFSSSWNTLMASNFRATVDWKGLGEGEHKLPIKVTCSDRSVTITGTQPKTALVQLERLEKSAIEVTVDIPDKDAVPLGYSVEPPTITPRYVSVEGPALLVQRVKAVTASVSLAGQRTAVERVVDVHAVDESGKVVSNVKVTPQSVTVGFDIQKKLNYREVAVRARTKGNPARGYFVSSVNVEPATVTVFGSPSLIATLPGLVSVKGEVDVTGATRTIIERQELDLPQGVSVLAEQQGQTPEILVTVEIDAVKGGTTLEVPLKFKKLQDGLTAKLSVPSVDVILTGPAVLLDDLKIDELEAYVDLGGLGVGTHQVKTVVDILIAKNANLADLVVTSISPEYVEADIKELPSTMTPSPTSTLGPSPTLEATPTITVTVTVTVTGRRTVSPQATVTGSPAHNSD